MASPHLNAYGGVFQITLTDGSSAVDVSAATTKQIIFEDPDGTVTSKTAVWVTDGTDGKIKYTAESGLLDATGVWKIQGRVTDSSSFDYRSAKGTFTVETILS